MNPDSPSRTFIGSVVCIDLVGYSKQPVDRQIAIKAAFNRLLGQALEGIPPEDRIILDTGDGAAVSFLGDPEQGLAVGQQLRKSMNASAAKLGAAGGASPVRIGIHLGPVRVAMDLNGHPKIIGDGITVAERIMDFAQPGEIAVSRPYHDMVSRLSEEHARLFRHEGARTDRNGREHDLYFLEGADLKRRPAKATAAAGGTAAEGALVAFLRDRAKVGFAAALLVAVIVAEVAYLASRSPTAPPVSTVAGTPAAPAIDPPAASTAPAPAPVPSGLPPAAPPTSPPPEPKPASPVPKAETPTPSRADAKPAAPAKAEPAAVKNEVKAAPKPEPRPETKPAPARIEPKPAAKKDEAKAPAKPEPRPEPKPEPKPEPRPEPLPPKAEEPRAAPAPAPPATTLVTRVSPEFPRAAVVEGIAGGTVKARLRINAQGSVTDVTILVADPPRVFDRAAVRALENWKFNPGAPGRTYDVEIEFKR